MLVKACCRLHWRQPIWVIHWYCPVSLTKVWQSSDKPFQALRQFGRALAQLGQFEAARAVYERELSVAEAVVGPEHRFAQEARARLASIENRP